MYETIDKNGAKIIHVFLKNFGFCVAVFSYSRSLKHATTPLTRHGGVFGHAEALG